MYYQLLGIVVYNLKKKYVQLQWINNIYIVLCYFKTFCTITIIMLKKYV